MRKIEVVEGCVCDVDGGFETDDCVDELADLVLASSNGLASVSEGVLAVGGMVVVLLVD